MGDACRPDFRPDLHWHQASGDIVLVKIDNQSLRDVGRWPWPRRYHAQLIDQLSKDGAKRILLDINFFGADHLVQAAWGAPSGSRVRGDYKYLFFANGCQPACGIQDVVILERGQVVDAIVRDPRHRYDGVSSSPPGRTPAATVSTPTGSPSR